MNQLCEGWWVVVNGREGTDIFHEISIHIGEGLEPAGESSSGGLCGSRTKSLKMDEISDLPASGLPAWSSQAIRQVSSTAAAPVKSRIRPLKLMRSRESWLLQGVTMPSANNSWITYIDSLLQRGRDRDWRTDFWILMLQRCEMDHIDFPSVLRQSSANEQSWKLWLLFII